MTQLQIKYQNKRHTMSDVEFGPWLVENGLTVDRDGNLHRKKEIGNFPLYGYQKVGVEFIVRSNGRALIADEPGLGKSIQSIAYAVLKERKTLIISPKSVVPHWLREIKRFAGLAANLWTVEGPDKNNMKAQFHVINIDIVERFVSELNKLKFALMVVDEATSLKNRQSKRSKSIIGYAGKDKSSPESKVYPGIKTQDVLLLTGTPVLNRPIEAFTLLHFLDKTRFDSFYHFTQKYGGWKGAPAKNLTELHEHTKALIIRRRKKDVLTELPSKQRNDLVVELDVAETREYNGLLRDLFKTWSSSGKPTLADMHILQSFLIEKKIPRLIEMIDELLEAGRSVLVFSCYLDPLDLLKDHYGKLAAVVNGTMTSKKRQASIDSLRDGIAKVGLFGIKSGGMGIDGLQYSIDTVIFLDQDWVPASHTQAEDRAHRNGQTKQVQVFYMIVLDTIDEYMRTVLSEKMRVIDTVVDGKLIEVVRQKNFFKEFVHVLRTKYLNDAMGDIESIPDNDIDLAA